MQGVAVMKTAKDMVSEQYLTLLHGKFPFLGMAVPVKDNNPPKLLLDTSDEWNVENLMEIQKQLDGKAALFYFTAQPEGKVLTPQNIMPVPILFDNNGDPTLACCIAGDWPEFERVGSTPDTFTAINELIIPSITKIAKGSKDGLTAIWAELDDPITRRNLLSGFGDGSLVFVTANASFKWLHKGELSHGFRWGLTSHKLGYSEGEHPVKEEVVEKPQGILGKLASLGGISKPKAEPAKVEPKVDAPKPQEPAVKTIEKEIPAPPPSTSLPPITTGAIRMTWITYPQGMKDKNQKKRWIKDVTGKDAQKGYNDPENPPHFWVKEASLGTKITRYSKLDPQPAAPGKDDKNYYLEAGAAGWNKMSAALASGVTEGKIVPVDPNAEKPKSALSGMGGLGKPKAEEKQNPPGVHTVKETPKKEEFQPFTPPKVGGEEVAPIISPDDVKKLQEGLFKKPNFVKAVDVRTGQGVIDPKKIPLLEKDTPSFSAQMKISPTVPLGWTYSDLCELVYDHPEAMVLLALEWRDAIAQKLFKPVTETSKVEETVVEQPKTEKKMGMFGGMGGWKKSA